MEKRLENKVIVIAGGTRGVGRAAAEEFARQGAKVVIGDLDEGAALRSIRLMKTYGSEGHFVYTDLRDIKYCKTLFDEAYNKFGKIDGFYMYSGVTPVSPLDTCDEKTYDWVMDVNFKGCFFCCQHAIKYMRMNGGGSIVFTGSAHAWGGQRTARERPYGRRWRPNRGSAASESERQRYRSRSYHGILPTVRSGSWKNRCNRS